KKSQPPAGPRHVLDRIEPPRTAIAGDPARRRVNDGGIVAGTDVDGVEQEDAPQRHAVKQAIGVAGLVQMLDQLDVIRSNRKDAALALGDAVTAIIVDVDVEAICLKELELANDLVGEHGVAEGDKHIASSRTARV